MLSLYPAIFYKENGGGISVIFPDLNHLATCGDNIKEAMEMAIDCLAGCIYSAQIDGESLPEPTPIEKVDIHCEDDEYDDYESSFVNIVAVDVQDYAAKHFEKPVKKTLVVPVWLNETATNLNVNFSAALKNRLLAICSSPPDEDILEKVACDFSLTKTLGSGKKPESEKNIKKTLSLPKWLNERAIAMNVNFSAVLKDALLEACQDKLEKEKV